MRVPAGDPRALAYVAGPAVAGQPRPWLADRPRGTTSPEMWLKFWHESFRGKGLKKSRNLFFCTENGP